MRFKNPQNSYTIETSIPGLWTLLFGGLFFAKHGIWTHCFISIVLAFITWGISWLIYPFFASSIVRDAYLRRGWIEVD